MTKNNNHKDKEMEELIRRKKDENEALKNILEKLKENPPKTKIVNKKKK